MENQIIKRKSHTKILLISDNTTDVSNIKARLEESISFPCYIWQCSTLGEALYYLDGKKLRANIIILDLGLTDIMSPKDIYEKIGESARNIPIIVMTGAGDEDHDLATFVMEAGASDHMIRGEFSRLSDAIEFALIRHKITTETSARNRHDQDNIKEDHIIASRKAKSKSDNKIQEKNDIISWITGGYSVENNLEREK